MSAWTWKQHAVVISAVLAWTALDPLSGHTQVRPRLIPFQGRVTTATGGSLSDQTVAMTFAIYGQPEGQAEPLWSEVHPAVPGVPIRNGQINVLLGQITSLDDPAGNGSKPAVSFDQASRYLGITIGSGPGAQEMIPRHQLLPAFHARTSEVASAVVLNGVDANAIRTNAVTEGKLGTDAVTTTKIKDGTVGAADLAPKAVTNDKIDDGTITAAKLAPGVIPTVNPPLTLYATISPANPGRLPDTLSHLVSPVLVGDGTFKFTKNAGNAQNAKITCDGSTTSQGGDDACGGAKESIGVIFNASRAGNYEVCFEGRLEMSSYIVSDNNGVRVAAGATAEFLLAETGVASTARVPGSQGVSRVFGKSEYAPGLKFDSGLNTSITYSVKLCDIFSFGATGEKAIRLFGRAEYPQPQGGPSCATNCGASVSGPILLSVREIL